MTPKELASQFAKRFGGHPESTVRAPGRINLIGDHTDYSDGFVLPMAIDRSLLVAARRTDAHTLEVESFHFDHRVSIGLDEPIAIPEAPWARYAAGVAAMLQRRQIGVPGANLLIGGDLPPGAGLASSAALEVATALALLHLAGATLDPPAIADLCRQAEHEYADSPCGIMDQLCCVLAQADHALLIDCRSGGHEPIPLPLTDAAIVVLDTGVRHSIAGREYALRRHECAAALSAIQQAHPGVILLRDVTVEHVTTMSPILDSVLARRVRHVASENARVIRVADALRRGDLPAVGHLMNASHASLRDDFEVSCAELDRLVEIAQRTPGVYGARMTGGGFGGCAIALIETTNVESLRAAIDEHYGTRFESRADLFPVRPAAACVVTRYAGDGNPWSD